MTLMNTNQRIIPYAPWHRPRERYLGDGIYVTTIYGSHVIAALLYVLWRKAVRRG